MDKYRNFDELRNAERADIDFQIIRLRRPGAKAIIIAPHGGVIEPRTAEIARQIAGDAFSYYAFKAAKPGLHITSHHFDEPCCLALVRDHRWVVAIHGCKGEEPLVLLGGLDRKLITNIAVKLEERGIPHKTEGHDFPGREPSNICNRGLSGAGVQLELTMPFRKGNGYRTSSRQSSRC